MLCDDQPEKYFTFKALNEAASLLTHDPEAAERWRVVRAGARLPRGSDPRVWKNGGAPTPVRPRFAQTYGHNGAVTYLRNEDYTSMGACVPTLWTPWRIFACECCAHLACAHVVARARKYYELYPQWWQWVRSDCWIRTFSLPIS